MTSTLLWKQSFPDIVGGAGNTHKKVTHLLNEYCENANLVDIWRIRHPSEFRFTWAKTKPYVLMERLDFFLISFQLQQNVSATAIEHAFCSDHSIPTILLKLTSPP